MRRAALFLWVITIGCGDPVPDMVFEAGIPPATPDARPPRLGDDGGPPPPDVVPMGPFSEIAINEIQCRGDEWVELIWVGGAAPADLTGWWLNDSVDPARRLFLGADAQLGANTHFVVRFGEDAPFMLSCTEDQLTLGVGDQVITSVSWTELPESGTWGRLPNRTGPFTQTRATPGQANLPPSVGTVHLNEVQCRGEEWVELYAPGEDALDLSGWRLTDDPGNPARGQRLQGEIEAGGFRVIEGEVLGFGIGCGQDELRLIDAAGETNDSVQVGAPPRAYTYGRLPNGVGAWAPTDPTPGETNRAPVEDHPLFDPNRVNTISIALTPDGRMSLDSTPRTYVAARVEIEGHPERAVGVRLKGRYGSFRPLQEKPALKVKFIHEDGAAFLGLKKLALNNFAQDPSALAEWTAYTLFRAMGVPAPRVGYAVVSIDGEDKGLYAVVESMDDVALDRWFASTKHLYEGAYGQDLYPHVVADFELDEGDEDRADLAAVVNAFETNAPELVYGATTALVDWPEVLAAMATEIFIGHWDGYTPSRNNYFLHFDDAGRLSLLPWGTDQTFRDVLALDRGDGRLLRACFADLMCRAAFDASLVTVADAVDTLGLPAALDRRGQVLAPVAALDPFGLGEEQAYLDQLEETKRFLAERQAEIRDAVQCLSGADRDADDDGFDCAVDCDDGDPNTHPGAEEICGDGVDQNCTGWQDDGPDCPDCVPVNRGDHQYLVCTTPRTFDAAETHCRDQGAQMVVFEHPAEAVSIARAAMDVRWQRYWIGLTDRAREGAFAWVDGQPLGLDFWADDQPDNQGDSDCVLAEADSYGRWKDAPCDERYAVICETPCEAEDVDGDGYTECTGDCREGDRTIGPQRDELCGNLVDENCDGEVDDPATCPQCTIVTRGAHGYALCRSERGWSAAREECWRMGYDLPVLGDATESDWLIERAMSFDIWGVWIGLTDSEREGFFRWVDETALVYAPWAEGEPNDAGDGEDCAHTFPDGWNDLPCGMEIPFACEAPCDGRDADGDGLDNCGADCDDRDPEIGVECPR